MHSIGHPGKIGVPCHEIGERLPLAKHIVVHHAGPNEVIGSQNVKRTRHLVRVQIPLVPHHVFKIADLAFADEKTELSGVGEIVLRGKQRHRCQSDIAVAPHGCRSNRQQRTAETVPGRMDLPVRNDLGHSIKCRHDS